MVRKQHIPISNSAFLIYPKFVDDPVVEKKQIISEITISTLTDYYLYQTARGGSPDLTR